MAKDLGRKPLTMRVTAVGKRLLDLISERRGVSNTSIVEQLIRQEAERMGVVYDGKESGASQESGANDAETASA